MKKYRFLKEGEEIKAGDELVSTDGTKWHQVDGSIGSAVRKGCEDHFRRPIPLIGENRFLVTLSITVPVQFDCTGLSEEEMDELASETACRTILANPGEYVMDENVDWENSRIDNEEFQPKYRTLEAGEMVLEGDLYERSDKKWITIGSEILPHRVLESEAGRFQRKI